MTAPGRAREHPGPAPDRHPQADRAALSSMLWGFFPAQVLRTLSALGVPDLLDAGLRLTAITQVAGPTEYSILRAVPA